MEKGDEGDFTYPPTFGVPNGDCISNYSTILEEINEKLGLPRDERPDVEFIFCESKKEEGLVGIISSMGHSAVAYTLPEKVALCDEEIIGLTPTECSKGFTPRTTVMNICGKEAPSPMVNFMTLRAYLFGTVPPDRGNEQGGIYNRSYCSIRLYDVDEKAIKALHYSYLVLKEQDEMGLVSFNMLGGRLANVFQFLKPFAEKTARQGNCIAWVSEGLVNAGITRYPSLFPKIMFTHLLEESLLHSDPSKVKVVYIKEVQGCKKLYPGRFYNSLVGPLDWLRTWYYWDLEPFSDVIVEVPKGTTVAQVRAQKSRRPPTNFLWRNSVSICYCLLLAVIASFLPNFSSILILFVFGVLVAYALR